MPPDTPAHRRDPVRRVDRRLVSAVLGLTLLGGLGVGLIANAGDGAAKPTSGRYGDEAASRGGSRADVAPPGEVTTDPSPSVAAGPSATPGPSVVTGPSVRPSRPATRASGRPATPGGATSTSSSPGRTSPVAPSASRTTAGTATGPLIGGSWQVTVYYTAVESYHTDAAVDVTGCLVLECANGNQSLGRYPQSFVQAVKDEGTGRITSGPQAGRYLNWSYDTGYWLDDAPRDSAGRELIPFR
ncbi:MAG TPA: hypothetical protein VF163_02210, partial [Micromonosporaceae bacterium]